MGKGVKRRQMSSPEEEHERTFRVPGPFPGHPFPTRRGADPLDPRRSARNRDPAHLHDGAGILLVAVTLGPKVGVPLGFAPAEEGPRQRVRGAP